MNQTATTTRPTIETGDLPRVQNEIRELREPLENPTPDGRLKGWQGAKTFAPGRYILKRWRDGSFEFAKAGDPYNRASCMAAKRLMDATVAVEPEGALEVLAVDGDSLDRFGAFAIFATLLHTGAITREQVQAARDAMDADEDLFDAAL